MQVKLAALCLAAAIVIAATVNAASQETPASSQALAASDAPVIDMEQHCNSRSVRRGGPFYPTQAMARGIEGRVVLDCALTDDDRLSACQIVEETPANMQFGQASLRLACDPRFTASGAGSNTQLYERNGVRRVRRVVNWRIG
jgi:TonB family protein